MLRPNGKVRSYIAAKILNASAYYLQRRWNKIGLMFACTIVRVHPHDLGALYNTGLAFQRLGRLREALDSYTALITLSEDRDALLQRAEVWCDLGGWREAIADYTRALHILPSDADALLNRGAAFGTLRLWSDAEADFLAALAISPGDEVALRNLNLVQRLSDGVEVSGKRCPVDAYT